MKKFIVNIFLFVIPILLFYSTIDYVLFNTDTAFGLKRKFIKSNKDIECLFLGSSHTQNGINPVFLDLKTCNLAYSSQDVNIDYHLFFKYIKESKQIKKVVLEFDYHTLNRRHDENFFRLPWYYYYHGINLYSQNWIFKYWLYISNENFFNNFILKEYFYCINEDVFNVYGFIINDFHDVFEKLNYNSKEIISTADERLKYRHKETSQENFIKNLNQIEDIIKYCNKNNIEVYLFKTPVYETYLDNYIIDKNQTRLNALELLKSKYHVNILDYETFIVDAKYYKNDDHLNPNGAEILTKAVNQILIKK